MSLSMMLAAAMAAPSVADAPCVMPDGWSSVAARKSRYVIFGELHGTRQSPQFFGTVACALARERKRVLVAIEMTARENDKLQTAWRLPHDRFAAALLADVSDWSMLRDGGLTTKAMLEMLTRLHGEKSAGRTIDVVAFNGARDQTQKARFASLPGQGSHEAAQADNIRAAAAAGRYDHVLVLVGNIHARKQTVESRGVTFEPMAMQLASADQVTALNMVFASGGTWNCQRRSEAAGVPEQAIGKAGLDCSEHLAKGADSVSGAPRMMIGDLPRFSPTGSYDGWFWVGPIEASPPALDAPAPLQP